MKTISMTTNVLCSFGVLAVSAIGFASGALAQSAPIHHPTGHLKSSGAQLAGIPSPPVYRDFLPAAVDLSGYFPTVGNQGALGSCVAWASGYAARAYYARMIEHRDGTDPGNFPSPAFIYDAVHQPKGTDACGGNGTYTPDALRLLMHGVQSLADFPYDGQTCPYLTDAQLAKGTDFKISAAYYVGFQVDKNGNATPMPDRVAQVEAQLAQGNPVIVGAVVDDAFQAMHGPAGGSIWQAGPVGPNEHDGHEFTIVGYDDKQQEFKFINSWGAEWGDNGFGRLSFDTFMNRIDEAFVIELPGAPAVQLADTDFRSDIIGPGPTLRTDPNVGAATPANGVTEVAGLWCGKVDVAAGADGKKAATGFVGKDEDLAALKAKLGADVDTGKVEVAAWPLCETRLTLGAALANSKAPTIASGAVTLPDYAHYLYAVSYDSDGTVHQLAGLPFGAASSGSLTAQPGSNAKSILVVASEKPLLGDITSGESYRDFLTQLRQGVVEHGTDGQVGATLVAN